MYVLTNNCDELAAPFSIAYCDQMIAHYAKESVNDGKPQRWRDLAADSVTDWQLKRERAERAF